MRQGHATSDPTDIGPPRLSLAKNSSSSAATVDPDPSPASNNIPMKSRPTGSKETPARLGQSKQNRQRSGNDTVASREAHRPRTRVASQKARVLIREI